MNEIIKCNNQMKATAQYFPVVCLIIMLYKVDLADGIVDHANESY